MNNPQAALGEGVRCSDGGGRSCEGCGTTSSEVDKRHLKSFKYFAYL